MQTIHNHRLARLRACTHRPFTSLAPAPHTRHLQRLTHCRRAGWLHTHHAAAADMPAGDGGNQQQEFQVFPRIKESDPYRRLGLKREASPEEILNSKNYLLEQYKWHEPSREAIELAFDDVMQDRLRLRNKIGFRPPRTGRRGEAVADAPRKTWAEQFSDMFDPTLTMRGFLNEIIGYVAFAAWGFMTGDVSLPLACTLIYSIYKIQEKRKTRNPEGPWFGGNPLVGGIITASITLVIGSLVSLGAVTGIATLAGGQQSGLIVVQAILAILLSGVLAIMLK